MATVKQKPHFSTKTLILGLIIATVAVLGVIFLAQLLDGKPEVQQSPFVENVVAVHPSVGRAAGLAFTGWTALAMIVGGLLFGFGLATGITDEQIGSSQKQANAISIIACFVGLILVCASYLVPAYDVQSFTHITVTKDQISTVQNKDFKKKLQPDPGIELYLKSFRNQ
jgi:uncharacterized membrane protein YedE/YeeE